MITKEEAKEKVRNLIEKYEKITSERKLINEANTKNWLIEPFFEALGWNMRSEEITMEERVSKGRADYAFRSEGVLKFFVEAKAVKEDLNDPKFARQTIEYGWNRGITWAILTDFEGLKVFNCEWNEKNVWRNVLFDLTYKQFLGEFDKIWLLSAESFKTDEIGKYADKIGKRIPRRKISDYLLSEFIDWRNKLLSNLKKNYSDYSENDRDEIVQTFLDRLIFIRNCEDRGYEEKRLDASLRNYIFDKKDLNKSLKEVFRYYDENYDSKIFEFREIDKVNFDENLLRKILERLYKTEDENIAYDFSLIDADILGNLYEQYLSYISKKSQGIYYTPTYIVEYIVKNTLGELLKNKKINLNNVKILDPACGSGSFLIKAFDYLVTLDKKRNGGIDQTKIDLTGASASYGRKVEILKENIFGVDLDPKAVEIAQLNLLLKTAEKKHRLPTLQENIKIGNSLIDDENIAGNRAFKWEEEFKNIIKNGGFDVIIGNPPYVDIKQIDPKVVRYFFDKYSTVKNRMNLYAVFIEKALNLLKNGGYFGFIIPNSILYNESYQKIRALLLDKVTLRKIIRLPDNVFQGVKVETVILIYQKKKETTMNPNCEVLIYPRELTINVISKDNRAQIADFSQQTWKNEDNIINISANTSLIKLFKKIEQETKPLADICDFSLGLTPYDKYKGHTKGQIEERTFHSKTKKSATFKPLLSGENITRYGIFWDGKEYINYGAWLGAPRELRFFTKPRILIRQIISGKPPRIYGGYIEEEFYNTQIAFNILLKEGAEFNLKYLLSVLNSKLMNFYHKEKYLDPSKNLFQKILIANAKKFPIKNFSFEKQQKLIKLVDKILLRNKRLNEIKNKKTEEEALLRKEIQEIDEKIDQEVYKLYGITLEEQKIIEKSLQ